MPPNPCGLQRLCGSDKHRFSQIPVWMFLGWERDLPTLLCFWRRRMSQDGAAQSLGQFEFSQLCTSQDVLGHKSDKGSTTLHCLPSTCQSSPTDDQTPSLVKKAKPAKVARQTHHTGSSEGSTVFALAQGENWGQLWPTRWSGEVFPALPSLAEDAEETV